MEESRFESQADVPMASPGVPISFADRGQGRALFYLRFAAVAAAWAAVTVQDCEPDRFFVPKDELLGHEESVELAILDGEGGQGRGAGRGPEVGQCASLAALGKADRPARARQRALGL